MRATKMLICAVCVVTLWACKQKSAHHHMVWHENTHYTVEEKPALALNLMKEGNKRFLDGDMINTDYEEHIEATKDDQHPHTVILSCMDSRVPPEIVFDQGIGNVFVIRVAGNIEDTDILGSLEYAVKVKKVSLVLVMGHQNCGAVKGSIDDVQMGNLTHLLHHIKPAITNEADKAKMLEETAKKNVRMTMADILKHSPIITEIEKEGKLKIVGGYYHLGTGEVEFLE